MVQLLKISEATYRKPDPIRTGLHLINWLIILGDVPKLKRHFISYSFHKNGPIKKSVNWHGKLSETARHSSRMASHFSPAVLLCHNAEMPCQHPAHPPPDSHNQIIRKPLEVMLRPWSIMTHDASYGWKFATVNFKLREHLNWEHNGQQ